MYYKLDDIWTTADGRKLKVSEMTTSHLINTINLIQKRGAIVTKEYIDGSNDHYGIDADLCSHTFDYTEILKNMKEEVRNRKTWDERNNKDYDRLKDINVRLANIEEKLSRIGKGLKIIELDMGRDLKIVKGEVDVIKKDQRQGFKTILDKLVATQKSIFIKKDVKKTKK